MFLVIVKPFLIKLSISVFSFGNKIMSSYALTRGYGLFREVLLVAMTSFGIPRRTSKLSKVIT